ncbi:MAG: hypothetical protein WEB07_01815 [Natronospirillum sp.]
MVNPDEFLKKYGFDDEDNDEPDHSLEQHARERAKHLKRPNAGTPHDWEEWEKYKTEHPDQEHD